MPHLSANCYPVFQERAAKWRTSDGLMDGLTTNGVLVMHPTGEFVSEPGPGIWREISVCGNVFALRETRSAQQRGKLVRLETIDDAPQFSGVCQSRISSYINSLTSADFIIWVTDLK